MSNGFQRDLRFIFWAFRRDLPHRRVRLFLAIFTIAAAIGSYVFVQHSPKHHVTLGSWAAIYLCCFLVLFVSVGWNYLLNKPLRREYREKEAPSSRS